MFDKLLNGIPLHEAASFFVGLKNFEKTADENDVHSSEYAPPDETGRFEGQFTVPVEQALELMQDMLANELKTMYAYKVYANSLRDIAHHSIAEEFEDHADQELEHADFLMRRMAVLGGAVHGPDVPAPPPSTDPVDIIRRMVRIEQEGIERWNRLHAITASNPMKFKIEEYLTREQEHLDELWQLLPHQENPAVLSHRADSPMSPDAAGKIAALKRAEMPGGLPPTAMGQQPTPSQPMPLSGPAAGQVMSAKMAAAFSKLAKDDAEQVATGRSRALANAASGYEHDKHTKAEDAGENFGRLLGAYVGGKDALKFTKGHGKHLELAGALGGAVLGQHLGGKTLKHLGRKLDAHNFESKHPKTAAAMFKRALDEMGASMPALGSAEGVAAAPEMDPETLAYLHKEQEGRAAEQQNEQNFYKQKFEQASQELQAAQQQAQAAQQQMQQLQQQADQTGQQQQAAMQQAQQIQQAAMQNAQAAHQAATQAMQQSLQAQSESIQQAQLAVGMRDAVHSMRQGLMQMVQQQLPPATTAEASGMQADQLAASMGGQDNSQQPPMDPNQAGQPAAAPDAGTPPMSATPADASGAGTSPTPGAGAEPTMQDAVPQGQQGMMPEPMKAASASRDKLIGAIMGGAVGGLGSYTESRMSNDPLRKKIQELESRDKDEGLGFAGAMNLAQAKARLAVGEFAEKHPAAFTAMGVASGASTGASLSPTVRHMFGG